MSLSASSLCQLAGEAVSLYKRAGPDREVHLTPHELTSKAGPLARGGEHA